MTRKLLEHFFDRNDNDDMAPTPTRQQQQRSVSSSNPCRFSLPFLFFTNALVCCLTTWLVLHQKATMTTAPIHPTATPDYNLMIPEGSTPALPSLQKRWTSSSSSSSSKRGSIYGGNGDPPHLGGFTDMDLHGISPAAWHWMMEYVGIHSLLDVGCGRGISTSWFVHHGVPDVLCVEGSRDAYRHRMIPSHLMIQHDYRRGPWWPDHTYDAVWCVEFLEHVSSRFA